jgi:hypothetical protein
VICNKAYPLDKLLDVHRAFVAIAGATTRDYVSMDIPELVVNAVDAVVDEFATFVSIPRHLQRWFSAVKTIAPKQGVYFDVSQIEFSSSDRRVSTISTNAIIS